MKKIWTMACVLGSTQAFTQKQIDIADISKHMGDSVKICAQVFGGRFFEQSKNQQTLINVGAAFPNSPLTVVLPKALREKYANPETNWKDKNVCFTGKLIEFKGKPEIIVYDENQIALP
jgi:hypothetical protein